MSTTDSHAEAIIFIPGIKGTTLVNTNRASYDTIWSAIQSQYEEIELLELSYGTDNPAHGYDSWPASLIEPGQIEGLVYAEFLRDIRTKRPLYVFNYDWRQDSLHNAKKLQQFMTMVVNKSKASEHFDKPIRRFDLIAHSHGCNVIRQLTGFEGFRRIGQAVLVAPPLKGSLDAVDAVLTGEGVFPGVKAKVRKLIRTFPGALELLPSYGAAVFDTGALVDFFSAKHWQANITRPSNSHASKFVSTLKRAQFVQQQLPDWSKLRKPQREKVLIIARDGFETAQSVNVMQQMANEPKNFVALDDMHFSSNGDGTVSHASSCCWCEKILTLVATDSWRYRDYGHGFILKDERIQRLIRRFLARRKGGLPDFDWSIPGHSIKRVKQLIPTLSDQRPDWAIEME